MVKIITIGIPVTRTRKTRNDYKILVRNLLKFGHLDKKEKK